MPPLIPKLILGPVQNLHDARYAAAVGIDYLVFDTQGPFAHTPEEVLQIRDWLSGPQIILRLGSEPQEEIHAWLQRLQPVAVITLQPISNMNVGVFRPEQVNDNGTPVPCILESGMHDFSHIQVLDAPSTKTAARVDVALWLGAFSLNTEGLLDYEACDAFIQDYSSAKRG